MAKANYGFEKRQKELAKKKKQEEKRLKKEHKGENGDEPDPSILAAYLGLEAPAGEVSADDEESEDSED